MNSPRRPSLMATAKVNCSATGSSGHRESQHGTHKTPSGRRPFGRGVGLTAANLVERLPAIASGRDASLGDQTTGNVRAGCHTALLLSLGRCASRVSAGHLSRFSNRTFGAARLCGRLYGLESLTEPTSPIASKDTR